jgi:hypothetical protein
MIYLYYKTDGSVERIESEKPLEYARLSELVGEGGMIEFAPEEDDGSVPMCNEEGLLLMLPRNPFFAPKHQPFYVGNILLGKNVMSDDGIEFHGFDESEVEKFVRKPIGYDQSLFKKDKVFTIIAIGDFMAQTTRSSVKSTGEMYKGTPVFKKNEKGARSKFTLRNLESPETLLFEGVDLPFKIDGEVTVNQNNGFTSTLVRGNALINLVGDADEIKKYIETKNLNPFFNAFDRINHCEGQEKETLLYTEAPTDSRMVLDKRQAQLKRK